MKRFQSCLGRVAVIQYCGAAAIVLLLAACGGGNNETPKSDASAPPAASQPDAGASTPSTAKPQLHCAP